MMEHIHKKQAFIISIISLLFSWQEGMILAKTVFQILNTTKVDVKILTCFLVLLTLAFDAVIIKHTEDAQCFGRKGFEASP